MENSTGTVFLRKHWVGISHDQGCQQTDDPLWYQVYDNLLHRTVTPPTHHPQKISIIGVQKPADSPYLNGLLMILSQTAFDIMLECASKNCVTFDTVDLELAQGSPKLVLSQMVKLK